MPLLYETHEGVTRLTLNRPDKRNALARAHSPLSQHLSAPRRSPFAGGDPQWAWSTFCAGADLTQMAAMAKASLEENTQDAHQLATLLYHLYHFPKPTLAQVRRHLRGGID